MLSNLAATFAVLAAAFGIVYAHIGTHGVQEYEKQSIDERGDGAPTMGGDSAPASDGGRSFTAGAGEWSSSECLIFLLDDDSRRTSFLAFF